MNENNPNDQWTNSETKQVALIIENNLIPKDFWDNSPEDQKTILTDIFKNFDLVKHLPDVSDFDVNWFELWRYLHDTFLEHEEKIQNTPVLTDITGLLSPLFNKKGR